LCLPAAQHAYYLDVQNKRPEYISTFVNELINWDKVGQGHASMGDPVSCTVDRVQACSNLQLCYSCGASLHRWLSAMLLLRPEHTFAWRPEKKTHTSREMRS
jgi:Iron/manganese superoxide dismutases, C-terminal domain